MKIIIFGGFLGSGKTSTILRVIAEIAARGETAAIIENEIGEKGIDDKLFSGSGLTVKPLFGGCVCCQITGDLLAAIQEIGKQVQPDWLIIEMTGLAVPGGVAAAIRQRDAGQTACKTVALVDAERWRVLIRALEPLITSQIRDSDAVIINKTDVAGLDLDKVMAEVKAIGGDIPVFCSNAAARLPFRALEEALGFGSGHGF